MSKSREQSNILNGGETITNHAADVDALRIKEFEDQTAPLLVFERALGDFEPLEVIKESMDIWVSKTGSDATGDGTFDNPYASPHQAMEWLKYRAIIGEETIVTIRITAGEYVFDKPIISDNKYGEKIYFIGDELTGPKPIGFQHANWTSNRYTPTVPARGPNEFSNRAGTMNAHATESERDAQRDIDRGENLTLIKGRYATVLTFTGASSGFMTQGGHIGLIDRIAIIGSYTKSNANNGEYASGVHATAGVAWKKGKIDNNSEDLMGAHGSKIAIGDQVAIHGFHFSGLYAGGSCMIQGIIFGNKEGQDNEEMWRRKGFTVTGCGYGVYAHVGGYIYCNGSCLQGNQRSQYISQSSSTIYAYNSECSGGGSHGYYSVRSSSLICNESYSNGNRHSGFAVSLSGELSCYNSKSQGNYDYGYYAGYGSGMIAIGGQAYGNANSGFVATHNASITAYTIADYNKTQSTNNYVDGVFAAEGSYIDANNMYVYNNGAHGVIADSNGTIDIVNTTPHNTYQRSHIIDNGGQYSSGKYMQVAATWNGTVKCYGSYIRRKSGIDYYAVYAGHNGSIYMSATSPTNKNTTISANGALTVALVYASLGGQIYDSKSNLSPYPTNTLFYSPVGNTLGSNGGYNYVAA